MAARYHKKFSKPLRPQYVRRAAMKRDDINNRHTQPTDRDTGKGDMTKGPPLVKYRRAASHSSSAGRPERRSGADRRQYERVLVDWSVDYRASDTFLFAYISDISAMGIFVRTPTPEPAGTRLNLRFSPPGGPAMEVEAQVIWINPPRDDGDTSRQPGMGLQFVDLTPLQRDQVLRLVRTFAYLPDDNADDNEGESEGSAATGPQAGNAGLC
jgi:type IV pilus assembly protein PilZ